MTRKRQVNSKNLNRVVLNRDFLKQNRSLFIGKEELCRLYPNAKPEHIEMVLERFGEYECDEGESKIELFGKVLAAVIIDETIGKRGGAHEHH